VVAGTRPGAGLRGRRRRRATPTAVHAGPASRNTRLLARLRHHPQSGPVGRVLPANAGARTAGGGRDGSGGNGHGDRLWPKPAENPENHSGVADLESGKVNACVA
jgi:hypothetical protein